MLLLRGNYHLFDCLKEGKFIVAVGPTPPREPKKVCIYLEAVIMIVHTFVKLRVVKNLLHMTMSSLYQWMKWYVTSCMYFVTIYVLLFYTNSRNLQLVISKVFQQNTSILDAEIQMYELVYFYNTCSCQVHLVHNSTLLL